MQAVSCIILHADATYKCVWQGYPVLIVGTTDADRHFHHFGLAICMNEATADFEFVFSALKKGSVMVSAEPIDPKVLVSDASAAIKKAFGNVFGIDRKTVTCWIHMMRNMEKRLKSLKKETADGMREDIFYLQTLHDEKVFSIGIQLFISKWEASEMEFIRYFQKEWIEKNGEWYEGY